jgi:PAS domain S-box-containing protein
MGLLKLLSLIPPTLWLPAGSLCPGTVAPGLASLSSYAASGISLTAALISLMLLLASVSRAKKITGSRRLSFTDQTNGNGTAAKDKEERQTFFALAEGSQQFIGICHRDFTPFYINPAGMCLVGIPDLEAARQLKLLDCVFPEDQQFMSEEFFPRVLREGKGEIEIRIRHFQTGAPIWMHHNVFNIRDDGGAVIAWATIGHNITERKRAEADLREAERKYRDMFENAGEGIFQSTPEGQYLTANPALAQMYGFESPDELIRSRKDITQQAYVEPARRAEFKRLLAAQGTVREFEHQIFRKDRSKIWISVNARVVRDEQGRILYYEGTAQDITARKLAEQALRKSEERYRELFENAREAHYVHDLNGRYTSVNRAAEKLSGYTRDEILGQPFTRFIPVEQIERFREFFCRKLIERGETSYEAELITKDGRRVPIEISSQMIFEDGMPRGVQGTVRDINERRLAQEALVKLASIAEQSNDAIITKSLTGIVNSWNRGAQLIFGYTAEEMLGQNVSMLMPPECQGELNDFLAEIGKGHRIERYETDRLTKDGRRIHVSLSLAPMLNAEGQIVGVSTIARDITEQRASEEKLKTTTRRLRALSHRLQLTREEEGTRIAREIHDELGSVLSSFRWDLEVAQGIVAGPLRSSQLALLQEKLAGLITLSGSALHAIRRIASELRPSVLDDLGLLAAIEWQSDQFQSRTGITCHCDCGLEDIDLSEAQSTAVFRILQEALTNVLRHAQATRVRISAARKGDYFVLSISDNGKGISESEKSGNQSLGILGMRERAHLIESEITISGVAEKGTTIRVRVPLAAENVKPPGVA